MDKKNLAHLLDKYRRGECTAQEKELLEQWLGTLEDITQREPVFQSNEESEATEKQIWSSIASKQLKENNRTLWPVLRYAAVWIGILLSGYILYEFLPASFNPLASHEVKWDTLQTGRQILRAELPDGSWLALNAATTVRYPENFGEEQRIIELLKGEAVFDVKRDTLKPFIVHARGVTTEVLGTRFTVTAYELLDEVKVSVDHGKVKVSDSLNVLGLLTKDQALRYNLSRQIATAEEDLTRFDPEHNRVFIGNCSFSELVKRIKNTYGYTLHAGSDEVLQYAFTGEIILNEPVEKTLQKFSAIHGGTFRIEGKEAYMY